jgi:magnesium-transporting ATPase (P-type)
MRAGRDALHHRYMTQARNTVPRTSTVESAHASNIQAVERALKTSAVFGLADEDAAARLEEDGPNRLSRPERPPYGRIAFRQLIDPLVGLLVVAAVVSAGIGEELAASVIAAIVLLNGVLGFVQETRSERAVLALREGFEQTARVVRGGRMREVRSDEIVRGDLLLLAGGDRVAADGRMVEGAGLEADESILTGESVPVRRAPRPPTRRLHWPSARRWCSRARPSREVAEQPSSRPPGPRPRSASSLP